MRFPTGLGIGLVLALDAWTGQVHLVTGPRNLAATATATTTTTAAASAAAKWRRLGAIHIQRLSSIQLFKKVFGLLQGNFVFLQNASFASLLLLIVVGWW